MEDTNSEGQIIDCLEEDEVPSNIDEGFNSLEHRTGQLENSDDSPVAISLLTKEIAPELSQEPVNEELQRNIHKEYPMIVPEEEFHHNVPGDIVYGFQGIVREVDCETCDDNDECLNWLTSIQETTDGYNDKKSMLVTNDLYYYKQDGYTSPTPAILKLPLTSVEPLVTLEPLAIAEPTPPPTQPKEETAQDQGDRVIVPVYNNILSDRAVDNALVSFGPSYLSQLGEPHNPIVYVPSKSCLSTGEPAIFITGKEERENASVVKELYSDEMEMFPPDYYQTDLHRPDNEIVLPLHNRPLPFVTNDRDCPAIDIIVGNDKHRDVTFIKDSGRYYGVQRWEDSTQSESFLFSLKLACQ